ncbi:MAG: hypothetical protein K9M82_07935 [Deltaproteobacteria bacterium]|nr:hypothetical protein [Deltaproteobacteria bacterium]
MKLLHLTFRHEFSEAIERILDRHGISDFIRKPMIHGRDRDGKHYGSKVYPGNTTLVQALVEDERVGDLLEDLKSFRNEKPSHAHLRAAVIPVEELL